MKCPNCNEVLQITERQNVEIDYCPNCRGVWLDKGELDKFIDYSNQQISNQSKKYDDDNDYNNKQNDKYQRINSGDHYQGKNAKKKSFLNDLFDFG